MATLPTRKVPNYKASLPEGRCAPLPAIMEKDPVSKSEELDEEHLAWAIEQRAAVQHTLLALHEFVRHSSAHTLDGDTRFLLDLLIGAAFSLWRAVFLADTFRDVVKIQQSQEAFLLKSKSPLERRVLPGERQNFGFPAREDISELRLRCRLE